MADLAAKVLVVDDLADNRNVLSRQLARMGCDVAMASNGREALESIKKKDHEIILLDLMMPEIDGFEVIERLRSGEENDGPSIIAVSARHDTEAITRALNLGANDYVTKPYDFPVVWARIEKQLNQARSTAIMRDVNTRLVRRLAKFREKEHNAAAGKDGAAESIICKSLDLANRRDLKTKLSHEVRTRLHNILGLSQQLQRWDIERIGAEEAKANLREMEKSSRGILAIVEDLTDFLTLQEELPSPADVDVNLRDAVLHEWEMLDTGQDAIPAKFNLYTDDPKLTVKGSPYYIRKAISAVLSNAVRFTEKVPSVVVRLEPACDKFYKVAIEDNGIGIPPECRKDALAPFYQIDGRYARKYDGLGLGLAIADRVMTLHYGKINIADAASSRGTLVELYFPYNNANRA